MRYSLPLIHYLTMNLIPCYRQSIGRILVEMFRTAVNNGTKLDVAEVMHPVQQIVEDPGKLNYRFGLV